MTIDLDELRRLADDGANDFYEAVTPATVLALLDRLAAAEAALAERGTGRAVRVTTAPLPHGHVDSLEAQLRLTRERLAEAEALLRGTQGWLEACATIADERDEAEQRTAERIATHPRRRVAQKGRLAVGSDDAFLFDREQAARRRPPLQATDPRAWGACWSDDLIAAAFAGRESVPIAEALRAIPLHNAVWLCCQYLARHDRAALVTFAERCAADAAARYAASAHRAARDARNAAEHAFAGDAADAADAAYVAAGSCDGWQIEWLLEAVS